jgi:hypothetical protein
MGYAPVKDRLDLREFVPLAECAKQLHVHIATLHLWARTKGFPIVKVGPGRSASAYVHIPTVREWLLSHMKVHNPQD